MEVFREIEEEEQGEVLMIEEQKIDIKIVKALTDAIFKEVSKIIVGKQYLIRKALIALYTNNNILLEGLPGIAKTYFAKSFASAVGCTFKRIQFMPDLLPSDILGVNVFNPKEGTFSFRHGPIFANIVLADEINRAAPKTQSAMLEAMQEHQITIEGQTYPLPSPFMVLATQNPIELEGTYPLPEAQVDRFFFKINLGYPSPDEEKEILRRKHYNVDFDVVKKVANPELIMSVQKFIKEGVFVDDAIMEYIRNLVSNTRGDTRLTLGSSPRGGISLLEASKANAVLDGRDYVLPEDVREIIFDGLNHRLILKPEVEIEGLNARIIINEIVAKTQVPR